MPFLFWNYGSYCILDSHQDLVRVHLVQEQKAFLRSSTLRSKDCALGRCGSAPRSRDRFWPTVALVTSGCGGTHILYGTASSMEQKAPAQSNKSLWFERPRHAINLEYCYIHSTTRRQQQQQHTQTSSKSSLAPTNIAIHFSSYGYHHHKQPCSSCRPSTVSEKTRIGFTTTLTATTTSKNKLKLRKKSKNVKANLLRTRNPY